MGSNAGILVRVGSQPVARLPDGVTLSGLPCARRVEIMQPPKPNAARVRRWLPKTKRPRRPKLPCAPHQLGCGCWRLPESALAPLFEGVRALLPGKSADPHKTAEDFL